MTKVAKKIARGSLDIETVFLSPNEPFTWASGVKNPIYCDNHITMSHPAVRKEIAESLTAKIKETFPEIEIIAGTTAIGIPHAAWITDILGLPTVYTRSKAKDHGKGNQTEGQTSEGQRMIAIEDLVSADGSVLEATGATERGGATVLGITIIFTYELPKGTANFANKQMTLPALANCSTLIGAALEANYIGEKDVTLLQEWGRDPEN